jgi:bifunctional non-homologous end joining protein LigD
VTERAFPDLNSRNKPTGRELQPITNQIQKRIKAAFIEPMQCKSVSALPVGEKWTFEIKFDGYRCIAVKRGSEVTLFSRHQKVLNGRFPGVVDALASLKGDFVLDGKLVAFDSQGRPSFQLLHGAVSASLPTHFYAFDVLDKDGELLVNYPLSQRRAMLESLLGGGAVAALSTTADSNKG